MRFKAILVSLLMALGVVGFATPALADYGTPAGSIWFWDECDNGVGCGHGPTITLDQTATRNHCIDLTGSNPLISVIQNNTDAKWYLYRTHACSGSTLIMQPHSLLSSYPGNSNWPAGWDNAVVAVVRKAIN